MISKIGVENRNLNSSYYTIPNNNKDSNSPSFKGGGLWLATIGLMQACERNPMLNVAVIDLLSAILPRTFVEMLTNWFAGFEAFRRESSGLIVNCLTPSLITMGAATVLNKFIMPKNTNMAGCWADSSLIEKAQEIYTNSNEKDKVSDTFRQMLKNIEGVDRRNTVKFSDYLSESEIETYVSKFKELTERDLSNLGWKEKRDAKKAIKAEIEKISKEISSKTHVYENITVTGKNSVKANTITTLFHDTVKFFNEFGKAEKDGIKMTEFAKRGKKLVRSKSLAGLAIVLPLAASMQFINRWITSKISGVDGAPIYEDYGKETNKESCKSKDGLLRQKIISITSMLTVGLLSMMKLPTWNMFEFKGIFPTMDQARIISTTTFASRMAAAEDKNELREATIRDICTFLSLYFLGDYAAKGAATAIEKKTGISLLNDTKQIGKDAGKLKKFWHWFKDVKLKSSEEVFSKTAEDLKLKGLEPNAEQKKIIEKELKKAINMRSACQLANLGVSLMLLGLIIPIFTRKSTKKKHAEEMKIAQQQTLSSCNLTNTGD